MLSLRRQLFVTYYLGEAKGNATLAARMAGYPHPDPSGPRMLGNVRIREAIAAGLADAAMKRDEVLGRLTMLARSDLDDFMVVSQDDPDDPVHLDFAKAKRRSKLGTAKKIKQKTRKIPREGGGFEIEREFELEIHDPMKALGLLAKYHNLVDGEKVVGAKKGDDPLLIYLPGNGRDAKPTP